MSRDTAVPVPTPSPWGLPYPPDRGVADRRAAAAVMRAPLRRIAVRTSRCFAIVPVDAILWLSADDNYVVVWADRPYRHKTTLDALCARLDPGRFVRIHRSHAVNVAAVRELHALGRGEFRLVLRDGTSLRSGRRFALVVATAFGLAV